MAAALDSCVPQTRTSSHQQSSPGPDLAPLSCSALPHQPFAASLHITQQWDQSVVGLAPVFNPKNIKNPEGPTTQAAPGNLSLSKLQPWNRQPSTPEEHDATNRTFVYGHLAGQSCNRVTPQSKQARHALLTGRADGPHRVWDLQVAHRRGPTHQVGTSPASRTS